MIVLYSNATGLKSAIADVDDLADFMTDYRVIDRKESDTATAYEIEWIKGGRRTAPNIIRVDRDEHDALLLMDDLTLIR